MTSILSSKKATTVILGPYVSQTMCRTEVCEASQCGDLCVKLERVKFKDCTEDRPDKEQPVKNIDSLDITFSLNDQHTVTT